MIKIFQSLVLAVVLLFSSSANAHFVWVVTTGESSTLRANVKGGAGGVFPVTVLTDWNCVKERTSVLRR